MNIWGFFQDLALVEYALSELVLCEDLVFNKKGSMIEYKIFNTHFKGLSSASLHSTSFRFLAARQAESLWSIVTKSVKKLETKWYQSYFWKIKFKFWENLNSDKVLEDIWPNTAIARCWTAATKQRGGQRPLVSWKNTSRVRQFRRKAGSVAALRAMHQLLCTRHALLWGAQWKF